MDFVSKNSERLRRPSGHYFATIKKCKKLLLKYENITKHRTIAKHGKIITTTLYIAFMSRYKTQIAIVTTMAFI